MAVIEVGREPENIKRRLRNLFEKLDGAYPDKIITRLHQDHKNWGETVTSLYRELGYPDGNSFLEAYGYKVEKTTGGRPKSNHMAVIDELKRRYANGPTCTKMDQLKEENPDLAPKFHNLANQANQLFGMTLVQYLILNGIMLGETPVDREKEYQRLKDRYHNHPYVGQMKDLRADNKDIKWSVVEWAFEHQDDAKTMKAFLVKEGILAEEKETINALQQLKDRYKDAPFEGPLKELKEANSDIRWSEVEKEFRKSKTAKTIAEFLVLEHVLSEQSLKTRKETLAELTLALQNKYKSKSIPESLEQIITENPDVSFDTLAKLAHSLHALSLEEYLAWKGLFRDPRAKKELAQIMAVLKPRYSDMPEIDKPSSISELQAANPDVDLRNITPLAKSSFGETGTNYLMQEGILINWGKVEEDRRKREEKERRRREEERAAIHQKREKELNSPIEPWNYTPKQFFVPEISVTEDAANDWVFEEKVADGSYELYLTDYQGESTHIILPVSISGKKVAGIASAPFLFKKCKAETVEIPGVFGRIPGHMFFQNNYLKHVVIGEGIKVIEEDAFFSAQNLEKVEASQSVEMVHGSNAFQLTKWLDSQKDYVFIGRVLLFYAGDGAVLNIPNGVKTIASIVTHKDVIKVFIPETVETMCEKAFAGRGSQNIQEFYIPKSLRNIGRKSFGVNKWIDSFGDNPIVINKKLYQWNTTSTEISIPDGVTSICDGVFEDGKKIRRVYFPATLEEIGDSAFKDCVSLTELVLPNKLRRIGQNAFNSCIKLNRVILDDALESIDSYAFANCSELKEVTLPKSVKRIGSFAFKGCSSLSEINLTDSIQEMGSGVFARCTALDNIIIPNGITAVGSEFFSNCSSLKNITIPNSVKALGPRAFEKCGLIEVITVPVKIAAETFSGCKNLVEAHLLAGSTTVPKDAFKDCEALRSIELPPSIIEIANNAFCNCMNLQKVDLSCSLQKIGVSAFQNCKALKSVAIPRTVSDIMDRAFMGCVSLKEVTFGGAVTHLGTDAFTNTPYLKNAFGEYAIIGGVLIKYLGRDTKVVIPNTVTVIAERAFAEARFITSLHIPDSVQSIGSWLFGSPSLDSSGKVALKTLDLGDGVVEIGDSAFQGAEKLTSVTFGRKLKIIGKQAFSVCKALKQVDLRETVIETIKDFAFYECFEMDSLFFPNTLQTIGESAFLKTKLKSVKLPKSTRTVGRSAFFGLEELFIYDSIEPDAVDAYEWSQEQGNSFYNSRIPYAVTDSYGSDYKFCPYGKQGCHISVLSTQNGTVRYRVFMDNEESYAYKRMMLSSWGKNASFRLVDYDNYFMKTRSLIGRAEMAFCRIQHPEGLTDEHRAIYDAYFERCMFIERSARRISSLIADDDSIERLEILFRYHAIDSRNLPWVKEIFAEKKATRCLSYLDDHFSK